MPLYQLTLPTNSQSDIETLQFIAGDVNSAITFANRYSSTHPAELWSDGRRICRLQYDEAAGTWSVAKPAKKQAGEGRA